MPRSGAMFATGASVGLKTEPWYEAGRKPLLKQSMPAGRDQAAVEHDEPGQVLALAAQAVGHPGAVAGPALEPAAGMQEVIGGGVLREIRDHRADDGQVVHAPGDVGKEVADRDAALAVLAKLPGALEHVAHVVELGRVGLDLDRLTVLAIEPGLGVERVDLGRPAVHVQEDDAPRPRRKMARPWRPAGPAGSRRQGPAGGSSPIIAPKAGSRSSAAQRHRAKTVGAAQEHVAAGQRARAKWRQCMDGRCPVPDTARSQADLIDENKLFYVDQHMAEVGPGLSLRLARPALPGFACRKARQSARLVGRWAAGRRRSRTGRRFAARSDGSGRARACSAQSAASLMHQRIIQQRQGLGGDVRDVAPAHAGERHRGVEGQEHRVQEVSPDVQVDASPAVAVERARPLRAAATFHERREIRRHARAEHRRIEPARDRQQGIADRFGLEPPHVHAMQVDVRRIEPLRVFLRARLLIR